MARWAAMRHHGLSGLVVAHGVQRVGDFRAGILRVGVVDVQSRAIGQDHVRHAEIGVGQLIRVGGGPGNLVAPDVPQRRLRLVVPTGRLTCCRGPVRLHNVVGELHRMQILFDEGVAETTGHCWLNQVPAR